MGRQSATSSTATVSSEAIEEIRESSLKVHILSDGDGPIGKYRRWCKQFYADPNAIP